MNTKHFLRAMTAILSIALAVPASAQCTGDIAPDGKIDGGDLGSMLSQWGPRTSAPLSIASDLDGDGLINGADLGILLANWGPCPSTVTAIAPAEGCVTGGTRITVSGAMLLGTSGVFIGGVPATAVTVESASVISATVPAGAPGPATVEVATPAGIVLAPQQFLYMPASVTSVVPTMGRWVGGADVTISGAYLGTTTGVTFGGTPATDLTVIDTNTITCRTPPGALGFSDIQVSGAKGTVTIPGAFHYVGYTLFAQSGTFTVPDGVTSIRVIAIGGGGGGGMGPSPAGGSGFVQAQTFSVFPGQVFAVEVGNGGAKGAPGSINGKDGAPSRFGTALVADGGGCAGGSGGGTFCNPDGGGRGGSAGSNGNRCGSDLVGCTGQGASFSAGFNLFQFNIVTAGNGGNPGTGCGGGGGGISVGGNSISAGSGWGTGGSGFGAGGGAGGYQYWTGIYWPGGDGAPGVVYVEW